MDEEGASPDQTDVLIQAGAVCTVLRELGYEPVLVSATLNISKLQREIKELRPSFVFNLAESVEGHGRFIHLPPAMLDSLQIPYTGSRTDAIYLTSNKLTTKKILAAAGLPFPPGFSRRDLLRSTVAPYGDYIIKSIWEHASIGLEEDSVVTVSNGEELLSRVEETEKRLGVDCFAELFIEGREFNLSLLAAAGGCQVLPPAEIRFEDYPERKPRIVGYRAKWLEDSFEYLHTVRSFEFEHSDQALLQSLSGIALRCWTLFELQGYARVDFRVDAEGRPWVLEINVNPCLSPGAGFAAAAERAGLSFKEVIERIIQDCDGL